MPKTTKSKVEIDVVDKTIQEMKENMDVLNKNMQYAIDQIEEIQSLVNDIAKIKKRMGI
tara:strand:- start:280 stop:456 length:177 start_codon:yes stop_codon:yes gene_type:complete